jgi:hypothetical protein
MNPTETVNDIANREDFIAFVRALACDLKEQPDTWENRDLASYLDALAAWTEDMDGYFRHAGEQSPDQPSWKLLGQILAAARVYE